MRETDMATRPGETATCSQPAEAIRVLLIDDQSDTLLPNLAQGLEPLGFVLTMENDPAKALQAVGNCKPDAILLDLHFLGHDNPRQRDTTGGRLLTEIRRDFPDVPVVLFTERLDDVDVPLEAFEGHPHGYFAKSALKRHGQWACELARAVWDAVATVRYAAAPEADDLGFQVGRTSRMHEAAAAIRTAATNRMTVLIYGEIGTGKRRAAEAIHGLSGRTGRFEHHNCRSSADFGTGDAALFGGSSGDGLLELANGGTLFLDEIQHLPTNLQDKVVTAVESGRMRRTGDPSDREVDVRLIVATNHNLSDLVADGALREDFAYRLAGCLPVSLPPLRQRMSVDLRALFAWLVERANKEAGRGVLTVLRPETQKKLEAHTWPGNIRELKSTLTRAVATTNSNVLLPDDIKIDPAVRPEAAAESPPTDAGASANIDQAMIAATTDHLESLPIVKDERCVRYEFLKSLGDTLRRDILIEFIRRLRERLQRRITHKVVAAELDPLDSSDSYDRDLGRIRQLLHGCDIHLTKLDFNQ